MKRPVKYIYLLGAFIFLIFTQFQCEEDICSNEIDVLTPFSVQISPEQKEYQIGDTIWLSEKITEDEVKQNSEADWLYAGDGSIRLFLLELEKGDTKIRLEAYKFDLVDSLGEIIKPESPPSNRRNVLLTYNNGIYELVVGVVPKFEGTFGFYLERGGIHYNNDPNCHYFFNLAYRDFSVTDYNREIYQEMNKLGEVSVGDEKGVYYIDLANSNAAFAFRVK